jgi:hypothetical protein
MTTGADARTPDARRDGRARPGHFVCGRTTLALAALVATSAIAKSIEIIDEDTARCGNTTLEDPDANVRADFRRDCADYNRPRD